MKRINFAVIIFLFVFCIPALPFQAQAVADDPDSAALEQLQAFLMDSVARRAYAEGSPQGREANQYLETFPPWAQQEILEIVTEIMRESKAEAGRHIQNYESQGVQSAYSGFSPAVRARIDALSKRLESDPSFKNQQNLQNMKSAMPRIQ